MVWSNLTEIGIVFLWKNRLNGLTKTKIISIHKCGINSICYKPYWWLSQTKRHNLSHTNHLPAIEVIRKIAPSSKRLSPSPEIRGFWLDICHFSCSSLHVWLLAVKCRVDSTANVTLYASHRVYIDFSLAPRSYQNSLSLVNISRNFRCVGIWWCCRCCFLYISLREINAVSWAGNVKEQWTLWVERHMNDWIWKY